MKYIVSICLMLFSSYALASDDSLAAPQQVCVKKPPSKEVSSCTHKAVKQQVKPVVKKEPCCQKGDSESTTLTNTSTTGNQTVNINTGTQQQNTTRIIERIQVRTKKIVKEINVTNPNRLLIILGATKTKLNIDADPCGCNMTANRQYEGDIGVQYVRDIGQFSGSLMGTFNGSVYVGLGVNF